MAEQVFRAEPDRACAEAFADMGPSGIASVLAASIDPHHLQADPGSPFNKLGSDGRDSPTAEDAFRSVLRPNPEALADPRVVALGQRVAALLAEVWGNTPEAPHA